MFNIAIFKKIFYQAFKFSIVGIFGVFINYSVFILALVVFEINYKCVFFLTPCMHSQGKS